MFGIYFKWDLMFYLMDDILVFFVCFKNRYRTETKHLDFDN